MIETTDRAKVHISQATHTDIPTIARIVESAYSKFIPRIGKPPAPMMTDYNSPEFSDALYVLKHDSQVVGAISLLPAAEERGQEASMAIDCIVVDQAMQGRGYGRMLMAFAESAARRKGYDAITLYTNEKMVENVTMYKKMGFEEIARKSEHGFDRVFFRKAIT